jgi:hypothetical protein
MELSDRGCRNPMVKLLYSARELKAAGHVFCFDKENREINNNHVTELYDRIKNDKSKRFMETLKVCEVKQALEQGRKVFDVDGNEITLDTPNLEKYILILDGQHRWIVILENPEYDIWVNFVVTKKIGAYIDNLNNSSKSWTGEDVKHSIRVQHENEVPVLDEINKFKNRFGVSEKYAEIILTRNKEQFRLSEMKEFQSHTKEFNADKFKVNTTYIDTGKNLMFAIIHQFGTEKLVRKIEFLEALFNIHEELIDAKKASFEKNILIFLTAMDGFVKGEILSKVKAKDIQKLNSYVRKQYDTLLNKHNGEGELEQMYNSAMEIIRQKETEFEKKENNPSKSFKKLKSGSPAEILANRKAEREDAEAKKTSESKPKKGKGTSSKVSNDSKVSDKK